MRTSTLLVMVAVLLAVPACKNLRNVPRQGSNSCVARDGDPRACTNMLPQDWRENPATVFALLADKSDQAKLKLTKKPVTKDRRTDIDCRNIGGGNDKKLGLKYDAPTAMANFPVNGTNGRDLLVASFEITKNERCRDARYGFLEPQGGGTGTVYFFITVRTTKVDPVKSGFDRKIGEWTSWRVYSKGGQVFTDDLRTGAYIQCGHEHDATYGDVAFASCIAKRKSSRSAVAGVFDRWFTIRTANASTTNGVVTNAQDGFSEEVDPAWGRCGGLGCCASY